MPVNVTVETGFTLIGAGEVTVTKERIQQSQAETTTPADEEETTRQTQESTRETAQGTQEETSSEAHTTSSAR